MEHCKDLFYIFTELILLFCSPLLLFVFYVYINYSADAFAVQFKAGK